MLGVGWVTSRDIRGCESPGHNGHHTNTRAHNEPLRRFNNHGEGPYYYSVPISCLLTVFRRPFSIVSSFVFSRCFQPGEGPSRSLLRDCENSAKVRCELLGPPDTSVWEITTPGRSSHSTFQMIHLLHAQLGFVLWWGLKTTVPFLDL